MNSKNYTVVITDSAYQDLRDISNYISKDLLDPEKAKEVIRKIANNISTLEQMPKRNPIVKDERLALSGIRTLFVVGHIVFYNLDKSSSFVIIIRILYKRKNWVELL